MLGTPKTTQLCCQSPQGRGIAQSLPCKQALGFVLLSTLVSADCTVLTAIVHAWGIVADWAMLGRDGRETKKTQNQNTRASRGTGTDWTSSSRTLVIVFSSRSTLPLLHHHKCTSLLIQHSLLSTWLSWCAKPCRNMKDFNKNEVFIQAFKDVNLKWSL